MHFLNRTVLQNQLRFFGSNGFGRFNLIFPILKGWPNQIHLRFPIQPIEPTGSVWFLKHCTHHTILFLS